jgi:nucleotide-binding universal stress UspA family protein
VLININTRMYGRLSSVWNMRKHCLEEGHIHCETHYLIRGHSPGEEIVQFAEDKQINEIIVGVKMRSKVGKLLMGSTAQYVILNAPCAVITIK